MEFLVDEEKDTHYIRIHCITPDQADDIVANISVLFIYKSHDI